MRRLRIKLNSAEITPGNAEHDIDEQFMQDLDSIITLEDGSSINLKKARLLYNPDSKKIELTDNESTPAGYTQVATLAVTKDEPEEPMTEEQAMDDKLPPELEDTDNEGGDNEVITADTSEEPAPTMPEEGEESGKFFQ